MTTVDQVPARGVPAEAPSHRMWLVVALVLLVALAVGLGVLWISEMNTSSDLEGDLSTMEADLARSQAEVASLEASVAADTDFVTSLEAEVAAVEAEAATRLHPMQSEVQDLYDRFLAAIADPDAETIASLFTSGALHVNASGTSMRGAAAIGEGWEEYGALVVRDPGVLLVHGDGPYVAAMRGNARGQDGLLVARMTQVGDDLLFSEMRWFSG